mmetsp:Transcript_36225/g.71271  ORF Transcript_36225/g.71271 Transcript_36225/m.71271 type:complete len:154 (+) Transcript_36225:247-708(+)
MEDIVPDLMSAEDYDMTAFTADFSFLADGNDGGLLQTTLVRDGTANEASSVTVLPPGQNQLDTLACDPGALVAGPTSEAPPQCRANSPVSPGFQKIETCRAAWRFVPRPTVPTLPPSLCTAFLSLRATRLPSISWLHSPMRPSLPCLPTTEKP